MITLRPDEQEVRRYLIEEQAKRADPARPLRARITYKTLAEGVDPGRRYSWSAYPRYNGIGPLLGHISQFEVEHGRPMLSALVVRAQGLRPGDRFYPLARKLGRLDSTDPDAEKRFWEAEIAEVVHYWTGEAEVAPGEAADAQHQAVMRELAEIKKLLRKLVYS
jgi:hypothetical protein